MNGSALLAGPAPPASAFDTKEPELQGHDKRNGSLNNGAQYASVHWTEHDNDHDHDRDAARTTRSRAGSSRFSVIAASAPPAASSFRRVDDRPKASESEDDSDPEADLVADDGLERPGSFVSQPSRHSWDIKGKGRELGDARSRLSIENGQRTSRPSSIASTPKHFSWESPDPSHQQLRNVSASQTHDRDGNIILGDIPKRTKRRSNTWAPSAGLSSLRKAASSREGSTSESDNSARHGHLPRSYSTKSATRSRTPSPVLSKRAHLPRSASEFLPSSTSSPSRPSSRRQTPRSASPMSFAQLRPLEPRADGNLPFSRPSSSSNISAAEVTMRPPPLRKKTSGLHMRARSGSRSTQASKQAQDHNHAYENRSQPRKRTKSNLSTAPPSLQNSPPQATSVKQTPERTFSNESTRRRKSSFGRVAFPMQETEAVTEEPAVVDAKAPDSDPASLAPGLESSRSRPFSIAALIQDGKPGQGTLASGEQSLLDIIKGVDVKAAHEMFKQAQANAQNSRQPLAPVQRSGSMSMSALDSGNVNLPQSASKSRVSSQPSTSSTRDNSTVSTSAPLLPSSPTAFSTWNKRGSVIIRDEVYVAPSPLPSKVAGEGKKKRRLSSIFGGAGKKEKGKAIQVSDEEEQFVGAQDTAAAIDMITPGMERVASRVKTELENRYQPVFTAIALEKPPPNIAEIARWRYRWDDRVKRNKQLSASQDSMSQSTSKRSLADLPEGRPTSIIDKLRGGAHKRSVWDVYPSDFATFAEMKGAILDSTDNYESEEGDVLRQAIGPSAKAIRRPQYYRHASSNHSLGSLESIHEGQMLGSSFEERYASAKQRQHSRDSQSLGSISFSPGRKQSISREEALPMADGPSTPQSATSPRSSRNGHSSHILSPRSSLRQSHGLKTSPEQLNNRHGTHNPLVRIQQGLSPSPPRLNKRHHSFDEYAHSNLDSGRSSQQHYVSAASPTTGPSDSENGIPLAVSYSRSQGDSKPTLSRHSSRSSSIVNLSKILPSRKSGRVSVDAEGYKSLDDGEVTDKSFTARFGRRPHWRAALPSRKGAKSNGVLSGEESAMEDAFDAGTVKVQEDAVVPYDVFEDTKRIRNIAVMGVDEEELAQGQDYLRELQNSLDQARARTSQIPVQLPKVVGEFHALNMERLHKGQLAVLAIPEPSFLADDVHGINLPEKVTSEDAAQQVDSYVSSSGEEINAGMSPISDPGQSGGSSPVAAKRFRSWTEPEPPSLERCVSIGQQNEREAVLQRSRTRTRVPHMDQVNKQLGQAREMLSQAREDARTGWMLHDEVNNAIKAARQLVNDQINRINNDLDPEISGVQNHIAEIWEIRHGIKVLTFEDFLLKAMGPFFSYIFGLSSITIATLQLIWSLRYPILAVCIAALAVHLYKAESAAFCSAVYLKSHDLGTNSGKLRDIHLTLTSYCRTILCSMHSAIHSSYRILQTSLPTNSITTAHK